MYVNKNIRLIGSTYPKWTMHKFPFKKILVSQIMDSKIYTIRIHYSFFKQISTKIFIGFDCR